MKNPRRDRIEYMLYATIMTSCTVALGLGTIFGFDEQGNRRKPVMDQPLEESWREAKLELYEYRIKKEMQMEHWMVQRGYGETWNKIASFWKRRNSNSNSNSSRQPPIIKAEEAKMTAKAPPSFLETAGKYDDDASSSGRRN